MPVNFVRDNRYRVSSWPTINIRTEQATASIPSQFNVLDYYNACYMERDQSASFVLTMRLGDSAPLCSKVEAPKDRTTLAERLPCSVQLDIPIHLRHALSYNSATASCTTEHERYAAFYFWHCARLLSISRCQLKT